MQKSIIEALFNGEIYPAESAGSDNPKYAKIIGELSEEKERLLEMLSDSTREFYKKVERLQNEANDIYCFDCFSRGFRLGAMLMLETIDSADTHIVNDE